MLAYHTAARFLIIYRKVVGTPYLTKLLLISAANSFYFAGIKCLFFLNLFIVPMTFEYVYALEGYCIVQVDGVLDDRTILSLLEF